MPFNASEQDNRAHKSASYIIPHQLESPLFFFFLALCIKSRQAHIFSLKHCKKALFQNCRWGDSNSRPTDYESVALPPEPHRLNFYFSMSINQMQDKISLLIMLATRTIYIFPLDMIFLCDTI